MNFSKVLIGVSVLLGVMNFAVAEGEADTVDFRKLKELMPEEINGMKRTECKGERNALGEITMSQARAVYQKGEGDNVPRAEVEIVQFGGKQGSLMAGTSAAWSKIKIDREDDDGYEKTVKIGDHPALERWNKNDKHSELSVFVGGRFIVNIRADNVVAGDAKKLAEKLPLDKLAALK